MRVYVQENIAAKRGHLRGIKLINDQELVQSEPKFRPRNKDGKQLKLQIDFNRIGTYS